jgi:two-component system, OmpR family, response regulator
MPTRPFPCHQLEPMPEKILLVDDEPNLRETLAFNLRSSGYQVVTAGDGIAALDQAQAEHPDLIILDLMLPELDGLTVCRSLRQISEVPVLVLTARTGELDKIVGLESGADDYMTKPFSLGELQARIRALLRRAGPRQTTEEIVAGDLVLNLVSRRAFLGGKELVLSPKEFGLLAELMRHQGAVLSRDLLLTRVWGYDYYGDNRTVDVHVRWLREKIEADPAEPVRIATVRGIGYRFER